MTPEDEIALLLAVSVSDVAPHNDHAARALVGRRARIVRRRMYAGGAVFVAIAALVFSTVSGFPDRRDTAASMRWERQISLDGGRLRIEPPAVGDVMSVNDEEARAVVRRVRPEGDTTVIASRWGRVTVSGEDGRPVPGFKGVVAWATVFRRSA
ncbi:MAG: hypothetical protein ABIM89_01370, partial [Mycobacteriales bacterium]